MSLSEYLLGELRALAARPTTDELRRRLARRTPRDSPYTRRLRGAPRARRSVIVLDASAVLELLLQTAAGRSLEPRLFASGESLHAPHLLDVEVAQVVRRFARAGELDQERGRELLQDLLDLRIERYSHELLLPRIWDLRATVTDYDAAYLALAELLGAPLLTRDAKLARALGHHARVELV